MSRRRNSHARWAAPAALLAATIAVIVVIRPTGGDDEPNQAAPPAAETAPATTGGGESSEKPAETTPSAPAETTPTTGGGPATYTIQPGDTLSAIATSTGVSVDELQRLNPDVNSNALTVGETLKLRGDGDDDDGE